jgi:hypothetical protein
MLPFFKYRTSFVFWADIGIMMKISMIMIGRSFFMIIQVNRLIV